MFRERWKAFLGIVFDPFTLVFLIATVILFFASISQSDPELAAQLTFLVSLSSGVVGGILGKRWENVMEEKLIVTRGKSAIRDLKLLLGNIAALEKRIRVYLSRQENSTLEVAEAYPVVNLYLEETIERCIYLQDQVLNAIQNWADVTPEADKVLEDIGVISDLNEKVAEKETEVSTLRGEIIEIAEREDKSKEEAEKLHKRLNQKEAELSSLRRELRSKVIDYGGSALSSHSSLVTGASVLQGTGSLRASPDLDLLGYGKSEGATDMKFCPNCHRAYLPAADILHGRGKETCPSCGHTIKSEDSEE